MVCSSDCKAPPPGKIEAYGDIAGIGVMLSFLLSAFMLVVYVIIYYVAVYDPDLDPYRTADKPNLRSKIPNPIDRSFLRIVRKLPRIVPHKLVESGVLEGSLINSARSFSDIQICTGIAILISGFRAYSCDLQVYHWQLIVYMAWLASVTHASVLSTLRNYLLNHRRQLWWRFGGMFIIATMLLVGIGLTFDFTWGDNEGRNFARCPSARETARDALETKLKLGFFLAYGYTIRVLKLFQAFDNTPRRLSLWLKQKSINIEDGSDQRLAWDPHTRGADRRRIRFIDPIIIAFCRVTHIHLDLLTSFLGEVFWLVISFAWATKRLLTVRTAAHITDENEWTFGQIFPLVLLAAPLITLVDHFSRRPQAPADDYCLTSGQDTHELTDLAELPTLSSGHPSTNDQKNIEYESRISFRGASIVAGFTYVHIAIFVFTSDNESPSITYAFGTLTFSCLVFQPALQMTWVIYSLWVPKLNLGEHRIMPLLDMIFLAICSILALHEIVQIYSEIARTTYITYEAGYVKTPPIFTSSMTTSGLFAAYLGFLGWFTWDSHVKAQSRNSCGLGKTVHLRCVAIACSILISFTANIPTIFPTILQTLIMTPEDLGPYTVIWLGVGTGSAFACQIVVEIVEFGIRRWARLHATPIRAAFLAIMILVMPGALFSSLYFLFRAHYLELLLSPLFTTVPLWVIIWICYHAFIKRDKTST